MGDSIEYTAREFLKRQGAGAKCYCRCKLNLDRRSELGWSLVVLEIRPTTWKEVQRVMDYLGRNDLEDQALCSSV